jgi:hypothetical protein
MVNDIIAGDIPREMSNSDQDRLHGAELRASSRIELGVAVLIFEQILDSETSKNGAVALDVLSKSY